MFVVLTRQVWGFGSRGLWLKDYGGLGGGGIRMYRVQRNFVVAA